MALVNPGAFQLVPDILGAQRKGLALQAQRQGLQQKEQLFGQQQKRQGEQDVVSRGKNVLDALTNAATQLKQISDPQQQLSILNQQLQEFSAAGFPTDAIEQGIQRLQQGDTEGFQKGLDQILAIGQEGGDRTVQQAVSIPGLGFKQQLRSGEVVLRELPPDDQEKVRQALERESERKARESGLKAGATEEAKILAAAERAGETKRGSQVETRRQDIINVGLAASRGVPILRRSLELLDFVKTGGFAAAQLRIRQSLGIEGADEGELSANLGKSVLSQLRGLFGSAFTEREGARLERIEAGFNKSPANNRRLLNNLLQLVEREAKSAIKAAVAAEDFSTAAEIKDLLDFQLTQEPEAQADDVTVDQLQGLSDEELQRLLK